jgi:predicted amidohydrolase
MIENVKVAAVSVDSKTGEGGDNLKKISDWTEKAADSGAHLVLFQELSLSGFIPNHPAGDHDRWLRAALKKTRQMAQRIPGPWIERLIDIAKKNDLLVSAGMIEDAGSLLHNTQVIVGPGGLLGKWRKMHIPMYEAPFYNGGGVPEVIETPLGRLGVNICFDAMLPESTRLLAVQSPDIVLFPFAADPAPATAAVWRAWALPFLQARCAENGVFGVASNYVGNIECMGIKQTFPGGGMVIGPRGELLAKSSIHTGQPGMMIASLDASDLQAARSEPEFTFRFRRPELYQSLTTKFHES